MDIIKTIALLFILSWCFFTSCSKSKALLINTRSEIASKTSFFGFEMYTFDFHGQMAKIVAPKVVNQQRSWIWRARFWGHEPQTDIALLERGFHLVYVDIADLYGNQEAIEIWNRFYNYIIDEYDLHRKVALEAMSRGGLIAYNWAAQNTTKVNCIYADAPVCDIKSWPGGLYGGIGSDKDWEVCLAAHSLDKNSVKSFRNIPLYNGIAVAKAKIPVLHVCGGADKVVPIEENTTLLKAIFESHGGHFQEIIKPGVGHHPHSLKDPQRIVDFIVRHSLD